MLAGSVTHVGNSLHRYQRVALTGLNFMGQGVGAKRAGWGCAATAGAAAPPPLHTRAPAPTVRALTTMLL